MTKNYDNEEGVWRTIGGRRVFIKTGQSLSEAMIESGKFKNDARTAYRKAKEEEMQLTSKQIDAGERLNKKAEDGVREDIKAYLSGKEDYDGSREDFINDLSNEWNVDKDKVEDILHEEGLKHPRLFKDERAGGALLNGKETYPKASGSPSFEDMGLQVSDKKAFSDYLQDKYGTDDFRVINYENKEGAKKIYDEYASQREKDRVSNYFNEQEKNAYLKKDWSYGYGKETLKNMSNQELDEYIKKNEELANEYTNNYNKSSQYDQRYTRNRQDKLFDSASKTKYEQQLKNALEEKARREEENNKYFKKVEKNEMPEAKDGSFIQQSTSPFYPDREYTKEELSKMEEVGIKPMKNSYGGNGWEGVNANKNLSTSEQAKAITDTMKEKYPDVKISRSSQTYSGGGSITFSVMSSDKDLYVSDADIDKMQFSDFGHLTSSLGFEKWADENVPNYKQEHTYRVEDVRKYAKENIANLKKGDNQSVSGNEWYLSDYGKKVMSDLNKTANSYTYDDSDAMVDYFNHGTYMFVNIGKWNKPYEASQKSASKSMNDVLRQKAYQKYLKEHPASKISFEDFTKKNK